MHSYDTIHNFHFDRQALIKDLVNWCIYLWSKLNSYYAWWIPFVVWKLQFNSKILANRVTNVYEQNKIICVAWCLEA